MKVLEMAEGTRGNQEYPHDKDRNEKYLHGRQPFPDQNGRKESRHRHFKREDRLHHGYLPDPQCFKIKECGQEHDHACYPENRRVRCKSGPDIGINERKKDNGAEGSDIKKRDPVTELPRALLYQKISQAPGEHCGNGEKDTHDEQWLLLSYGVWYTVGN